MAKPLSPDVLSQLVVFLLTRSSAVHARAEALRLVLQKRGDFPDADFQQLYDLLAAEATQRAEQLIDRLRTAESDAAIHQWLKDFEGTIH